MILKAFAIYDVKGEVYNTPFFFGANGQAIRAFKDLANDKQTTVGRHPGDFKLMVIGTFDDNSGELVASDEVVSLGFATDYIDRAEPSSLSPVRKGA